MGLRAECPHAHRGHDEPPDDATARPRRHPGRSPYGDGGPEARRAGRTVASAGTGEGRAVPGQRAPPRHRPRRPTPVPGSPRRSSARTGAPRHRRGTGRIRDPGGAPRGRAAARAGRRPHPDVEAGARPGPRRSSGPARRQPSGSSARRPTRSRSTTSTSAPPTYDETALIPIRARVLRSPASKASVRRSMVSAGARSSAPRVPASSAASSSASHGCTAVAPDGDDHRHRVDVQDVRRLDEQIRSARAVRRRSTPCGPRRRRGSTGSAAARCRTRRRSGDRTSVPARAAATASDASRSSAASSPAVPSAAGQSGSSRSRPDAAPRGATEQAVQIHHDRACQANGPWPARRPAKHRRPSTELHPQVHDGALALRVDRRIRDLRECLAQVIGHRAVEPASARGRRVVAHAPERLVRLERHRLDVQAGSFRVQAGEIARSVPSAPDASRWPRLPPRTGRRGPDVARRGSASSEAPRPWPRHPRGSRGGAAPRAAVRPAPGARDERSRRP